MDPREDELTHRVEPLGVTGPRIPRIQEGILLAADQSRLNGLRNTHMQMEEVIPQIDPRGDPQPSDCDRMYVPKSQTTDMDTQTGYTWDATAMATAFDQT